MSNYKHGSWRLSHESAALNVPSIEWLGLHSSVILERCFDDDAQGLLRLSDRDRKKGTKMLEKWPLEEEGPEQEWRRELQVMLMLGIKAEMEILADSKDGVVGWVKQRLLEEVQSEGDIMDC